MLTPSPNNGTLRLMNDDDDRASKLNDIKIGRSPYLLEPQSGYFFSGTCEGRNTVSNSCYRVTTYINKTCSINRTSVIGLHFDNERSARMKRRRKTF